MLSIQFPTYVWFPNLGNKAEIVAHHANRPIRCLRRRDVFALIPKQQERRELGTTAAKLVSEVNNTRIVDVNGELLKLCGPEVLRGEAMQPCKLLTSQEFVAIERAKSLYFPRTLKSSAGVIRHFDRFSSLLPDRERGL